MPPALVLPFSQIHPDDSSVVGETAICLSDLVRSKFPIANGFVVTSFAYQTFLNHTALPLVLKEILRDLNISNLKDVQKVSIKIQRLIQTSDIPTELISSVFQYYRKLSSAEAHPLISLNFPDQRLYTKGEANLIQSIRTAWASHWEHQALVHRIKERVNHFENLPPVTVQIAVSPEVSGIASSVNPVTGNKNQIFIDAVWGWGGNALIKNNNRSDRYIVNRQDLSIHSRQTSPQKSMDARPNHYQVTSVSVPKDKQNSSKLTDQNIVDLAKLAIKVQQHNFFPQAIEFAIAHDQIFIINSHVLDEKIFTTHPPATATKVYLALNSSEHLTAIAQENSAGLGFFTCESFLEKIDHNYKFSRDIKNNRHLDELTQYLADSAKSFGHRPVYYHLSDFPNNQETNPLLGFRGALRHLHNDELINLELEAVKNVRNKLGYKNLHLVCPLVRSTEELIKIKRLISATGLSRSNSFQILASIKTPANVFMIEPFIDAGVDGLYIDLDHLAGLMLGLDPYSDLFISTTHNDPSLLWALQTILKTARKYRIPSMVYAHSLQINSNLIQDLVSWGAASIVVDSSELHSTQTSLAYTETNLLRKYG